MKEKMEEMSALHTLMSATLSANVSAFMQISASLF